MGEPLAGHAARELGHAPLDPGTLQLVDASFVKAIETAFGVRDAVRVSRALEGLARAIAYGQPRAAVRIAGAARRLREAQAASAPPSDTRRLETWLPAERRALTESSFSAAWEAGRAMNTDDAVAFACNVTRRDSAPTIGRKQLTPRERQVLALVARGFSTQQIAAQLDIQTATTRTHLNRIMSKLRLHSRTQVALWANEHEFV